MNPLTTVVFGVVLATATIRAEPPAEGLEPIDVMKADFPALLHALTESRQPEGAKAAGAVNGYPALVDAAALIMKTVQELNPAGGAPADAPIVDFTVVYDGGYRQTEGGPSKEAVEKLTQKAMDELERRGLDALLDRAAAAPALVRGAWGTPERIEQERAMGITEPGNDRRLVMMLLPELGGFRQAARLSAARMHRAAAKGDWAAFTRAFEQGLALARGADAQATAIDRLVGLAIEELLYTQTTQLLTRYTVPADALERMREALHRQMGEKPGVDLALNGERLITLDACRWLFNDEGRMDVKALSELGSMVGSEAKGMGFLGATREGNVKAIDAWFGSAIRVARLPKPRRTELESIVTGLERRGADPDAVVIRLMAPALSKLLQGDDVVGLRRSGFEISLSIERFRRAAGSLPESLDAVVAKGLLDSVPVDRVTGQGIRYVRLDGPDEKGRTYWVYSVGADGEDNRGRQPDGPANVPLRPLYDPQKGAGFDYLVNDW